MSPSSGPPASPRFVVLAAVDGSAISERIVSAAVNHARAVVGGQLHLVHVVENLPAENPLVPLGRAMKVTRERLEKARELLEPLVRGVVEAGFEQVSGHIVGGETWREILNAAGHVSADVIVVGTHGRAGVSRLVLGSVAETIVRKAGCPVLVVRPKNWQSRDFPEIEPPCPDCLATQEASHGQRLWCERHSEHHPRAHTHYEMPEGFGAGSMLIRMV